jgi:hypothetical protein
MKEEDDTNEYLALTAEIKLHVTVTLVNNLKQKNCSRNVEEDNNNNNNNNKLLASWKKVVNVPRYSLWRAVVTMALSSWFVSIGVFIYQLSVNKFLLCEVFPQVTSYHRTN